MLKPKYLYLLSSTVFIQYSRRQTHLRGFIQKDVTIRACKEELKVTVKSE